MTLSERLSEYVRAAFSGIWVQSHEPDEAVVEISGLCRRNDRTIRGVGAQELRDSGDLRQQVGTKLSRVQSALDGMMVERPRRKIIRPNMTQGETS